MANWKVVPLTKKDKQVQAPPSVVIASTCGGIASLSSFSFNLARGFWNSRKPVIAYDNRDGELETPSFTALVKSSTNIVVIR